MNYLRAVFLISIIFMSCNQSERIIHSGKNKVEEYISQEGYERSDLHFQGNVRSFIEYDLLRFDTIDIIKTVLKEIPRYRFISADTLMKSIKAKSITDSNSMMFNEKGKVVKYVRWYAIKGQSDTRHTNVYLYDEHGNLLEKEEFFAHGENEELNEKQNFYYDRNNKLVKHCRVKVNDNDSGKNESCGSLTYRENDILFNIAEVDLEKGDTIKISRMMLNRNGVWTEDDTREVREFDERGNLIKLTEREPFLKIDRYTTLYNYDLNNNLIQESTYDRSGQLISSVSNYYDKEGKLRMMVKNDSDHTKIEHYNPNGQPSQYLDLDYRDTTTRKSSTRFEYDKFGNLIFQEDISKGEANYEYFSVKNYQLTYDESGNWIEQRVFENDSLTSITRREIIYY